MLYVFLVDTGTILTFDMNLALETVANLKEVLHRTCKVAPEKQVLLISGGESLDPTRRVCSYSAGTDTNPIFLFCKSTIESTVPPSPSINYGSAQDLKEKVEACLVDKESTYNTVVIRAQLAQLLHETAREITRTCEQLVHDQHMQQQGWAAVVANLEDIIHAFKGRVEIFEQAYGQYLTGRAENLEILSHFGEDLTILSDIPVLPSLLKDQAETSLLDWIHSNDDEHTNLNIIADLCCKALEQMDNNLLLNMQKHIESTLNSAERQEMKEIRGLGERLYGLEQLLVEARKKVLEQGELAQSIVQNQQRARNVNDTSILPDLCASHRQQLKVMLRHDEKLRDIRNRCSRAKEELSSNLHARLRWVVFVQRQLADVDSRLVLQNENLRRLRRHIDLLKQLHLAPSIYLKSLIEIVRRRQFASKFLSWADTLSGHSLALYQSEMAHRKTFSQLFEGHFLNIIFTGIDDNPPLFATTPPAPFDNELPVVTLEDLERLKNNLPSLWASLQLPDNLKETLKEHPILNMLHAAVLKCGASVEVQCDTGVLPSLSAALLSPPIRSMKAKVTRSQSEFHSNDFFLDDPLPSAHFPNRCTNKNCGDIRRELQEKIDEHHCRLLGTETQFQCFVESIQATIPSFKTELLQIRNSVVQLKTLHLECITETSSKLLEQNSLMNEVLREWEEKLKAAEERYRVEEEEKRETLLIVKNLRDEMNHLQRQYLFSEQEKQDIVAAGQLMLQKKEEEYEKDKENVIQKLVLEHELEMESIKEQRNLLQSDCETRILEWKAAAQQDTPDSLRHWKKELMLSHEVELEQLRLEKDTEIDNISKELDEAKTWKVKYEALEQEYQTKMAKMQEELQHKHRLEMEGLRSRFRMMASATLGDRSPSESSLEKYEFRPTPPTSPRVLSRTVTDGAPDISSSRAAAEDSRRFVERLLNEKERIMDLIEKAKSVHSKPSWWEEDLSNALRESNEVIDNLNSRVQQLERENGHLKRNVMTASRSLSQPGPVNMAASVAVLQSDDSNSTVPTQMKKRTSNKAIRTLLRQGSANIYGCEMGETVIVHWDERYSTHMLYNKGPYLHFLHSDSIAALNLKELDEPFLARVVLREFCLVRKEENRYRLPKGTNFYRVKIEKLNSN